MPILQFHISLPESRPPIWRRIQLTDDYRLDRFHQIIQIAMGWENSQLKHPKMKFTLWHQLH
jgi:hypothetical protein